MPEPAITEALDSVWQKRHGIEPGEQTTAEQLDEQRKAQEAAGLERSENREQSKREAQRLVRARSALMDVVTSLRHGRSYDAQDRAELRAEVEAALGGNLDANQKQHVRQLVDKACDAIEGGDLGSSLRQVDDVAVSLANGSAKFGTPIVADDDAESPAALAAQIARG